MVIFLTYEEVCNYIEEIPKFTVKHSPEHTKRLLACLGYPERDFAVIHVAGSNGKGSVCRAVSHVLTENGTQSGICKTGGSYRYVAVRREGCHIRADCAVKRKKSSAVLLA